MLEEKVGSNTSARYVWSPVYVNALVLRDRDTNADGTLDERLWAVQDANWNTVALVNGSGSVVERYAYDPYGSVSVMDGSYGSRSGSSYGWNVLFQGMRLDSLTGDYDDKGRVYSPSLMRFITVDPLGLGPDVNDYRFVGNGPVNRVDPSGLAEPQKQEPMPGEGATWTQVGQLIQAAYGHCDEFQCALAATVHLGQQYNSAYGHLLPLREQYTINEFKLNQLMATPPNMRDNASIIALRKAQLELLQQLRERLETLQSIHDQYTQAYTIMGLVPVP